jgi:hypothetical protein
MGMSRGFLLVSFCLSLGAQAFNPIKACGEWIRLKRDRLSLADMNKRFQFTAAIPDNLTLFQEKLSEIPTGTRIHIFSPLSRRLYAQEFHRSEEELGPTKKSWQRLVANSPYDDSLTAASVALGKPREFLQARTLGKNGQVLSIAETRIQGTRQRIEVPYSYMDRVYNAGIEKGAVLLEITHNHPRYEYFYVDSEGTRIILRSPLSRLDLTELYKYSRRYGIPVRMKAVMPNGYAYQMTLFKGEEIRDPLPPSREELDLAQELMDRESQRQSRAAPPAVQLRAERARGVRPRAAPPEIQRKLEENLPVPFGR